MAQRYRNIPNSFLQFDISLFIQEEDITQFILTNRNRFPFDIALLADQLAIYPKARYKLPSFTAAYTFFTPQSYEQASAEKIALFKSSLVSGKNMLDLSGGLGVDDWAFSKTIMQVDSIDIDDQLNRIVRRNFEKLGVTNITRTDADAYEFVNNLKQKYDFIYLDADRRVGENRTYALSDTEPDIISLKEKLFSFTPKILLKVSPMLDLSALMDELKTVSQIWVLALRNEVKEILIELLPGQIAPVTIHAVNIEEHREVVFSETWDTKISVNFSDEGNYFYEPSLALIKSGLASSYMHQHDISQLASNSIYGVGDECIPDFFGRSFRIVHREEFSKSRFSAYLRKHQLIKANVAKRNFKMEVAEIRKQFNIKEGGDDYLFFTENDNRLKLFFHCVKQ